MPKQNEHPKSNDGHRVFFAKLRPFHQIAFSDDHIEVLKCLHQIKRFSIFEATENQGIANCMQELSDSVCIEITPDHYPWSDVRLTDKGLKMIKEAGE